MAGTGHGYEVLNPAEAKAALAGVDAPNEAARAWLSSRAVLRFVTGAAFTVRLDAARAASEAEARTEPGRERDALVAKARAAGDLRLFVPQFLSALGPDFGHVMDWMRALGRDDPRELAKVRKLGVPEAVAAADRWSAALRRRAARNPQPGLTSVFCDGRAGRVWFELLDRAALTDESVRMDHCVEDYGSLLGCVSRIFSLRDVDGTSHVTAELVAAGAGEARLAGRQLKGFHNRTPSPAYRGDAIDLLVSAGCAARPFGDATGMGVYPLEEGGWRPLDEVGERYEVGGMAGYGIGATFWFASPLNPVEFVASGVGEPGWWRGGHPMVLTGTAGRELKLAELRALAAVHNAAPSCAVSVPGIRLGLDRKASAWTDLLPRTEADGAAILHGGEESFVVRAEEPTDVLAILKTEYSSLGASGVRRRDWSAADLRRVASALTIAGVRHLAVNGVAEHRIFGLDMAPDGTWHVWKEVASVRPGGPVSADGRSAHWEIAPWRGRLVRGDREKVLEFSTDEAGLVTAVSECAALPGDIDEAARLLNELGHAASPRLAEHYHSTLCWRDYGWGSLKAERALVTMCGRWSSPASAADVMSALSGRGKARFGHGDANEAAIRLLPEVGTDPAVDRELAGHLAAWAHRTPREAIRAGAHRRDMLGIHNRTRVLRRHSEDRFEAAAALRGFMTKREWTRVVSAASAFLRDRMGRRKRAKDFRDGTQESVRRMLAAFGAELPQTVIDRAVPYSFEICQKITVTDAAGRTAVDPFFEGLFDTLTRGAAKSRIADAAGSDLFTLRDRKPADFEEARSWMKLVAMACHSWRSTWARDVEARVAEACSENGWPAIEGPPERQANTNWWPIAA